MFASERNDTTKEHAIHWTIDSVGFAKEANRSWWKTASSNSDVRLHLSLNVNKKKLLIQNPNEKYKSALTWILPVCTQVLRLCKNPMHVALFVLWLNSFNIIGFNFDLNN